MTSRGRRQHAKQQAPSHIELTVDRPANGGAGVGRDDTGRTVFCDGALPGETVRVALHTQKKRFARGDVVDVLEPSPDRVTPACASHHEGCGGCDLAHASTAAQRATKNHVVRDSLIRLGRVNADEVDAAFAMHAASQVAIPHRYRTTVRVALDSGRAAYRRRSSHDLVAQTECLVVHEQLESLLLAASFDPTAGPEVVLRVSAATGERIAVVDGPPGTTAAPEDVRIVSRAALAAGADVTITEHAGGRSWQVSAGSFFQAGPDVASALVEAVRNAAGDLSGAVVVDAYAGIGLFAGTVGASASSVAAVERSGSSTIDARTNLAEMDAEVIESPVESWKATRADVVIADPARAGLGEDGVNALLGCRAERFVLVACDTGSLGRDVGLLAAHGYCVESVQVVDAFHDTSHIETIVGLRR